MPLNCLTTHTISSSPATLNRFAQPPGPNNKPAGQDRQFIKLSPLTVTSCLISVDATVILCRCPLGLLLMQSWLAVNVLDLDAVIGIRVILH